MSLNPFFLPHLPALPIAATFSPPCHPPSIKPLLRCYMEINRRFAAFSTRFMCDDRHLDQTPDTDKACNGIPP
jgi:hypothetical protein